MKKIVFIFCLAFTFTLPAWSSQGSETSDLLITIQTGYQELDTQSALQQYEIQKIDSQRAALLNILPLGFGSYQQGDIVGGVLVTLADLTAMAMIGMGISSGNGWGYIIGGGWAIVAYATGRVIGVISPAIHANAYNAELKKQLGLNNALTTYQNSAQPLNYASGLINMSQSF